MNSDSSFIRKEPCPACGSRDNLARYSDGHAHCFGCGHYEHGEEAQADRPHPKKRAVGLLSGEYVALDKRKISEETCRKFGYQVAEMGGKKVQVAPYYDSDGVMIAQKARFANKDFTTLGDFKSVQLFGQQLWGEGGKKVVVTEGEIDCMTVSQLQGNKWPVVSIPNGAQGAAKSLKKQLDWLCSFDEVILMFDMDEPGREASKECAELFPPGKCKVASLPLKDPNECLQANKGDTVITAIWQAKTYRPDGIVAGNDLWEIVRDDTAVIGKDYPWSGLNKILKGLRQAELVTFTAGSGIGKSAVVREIAHNLVSNGETVGMLMLEESTRRTALGLMGITLNKPIHIDRAGVSEADLKTAFDATVGSGRLFLYDHFGSTEIDNLLNRIRYMARALDCKWIILDHLSIVVSGLGDGDERRLIDNAMTALRTLVQETGVGLILVSHLKRPSGDRGHEEGAQTSLSQLRGSHSIAQLSDIVIGVERDQQGETPNMTTLRVLKNRFTGETGVGGYLVYDKETGRLYEIEKPEQASMFSDESTEDDCPF